MSARIIDGKAIADALMRDLRAQVEALEAPLHLAAIVAGDDPGLAAFVRLKQKAAHAAGVEYSVYEFAADDEAGAQQTLAYLAADEQVHGIFIELPLPAKWDQEALCSLIPLEKDVDLLSPAGERAFADDESPILPPAVQALRSVLTAIGQEVRGVRVAVVGQGKLVGAPIVRWLEREGARVVGVDVHTSDPAADTRAADIVIAGTGVPGLITDTWIKPGALVIDFGYGKKGDAYVGDVDATAVSRVAGAFTPVPGGMGPLVVVAVLENLLALVVRG
ncbi:MAG: bifunctional 5,10-methylenetetrahydrofolate dehydrogenase/5,10-methenyltetrahydrofolate cyclohydrolase [Candidatus Yanofskybacteria bacterium]|nr:bifunctional 5,10-methylenetetrahydrofolate dehydrogenase/5,10-methenyltetrahydrofolate cyclohydrolase [Candidatus Yanofskybacteria bacterium]